MRPFFSHIDLSEISFFRSALLDSGVIGVLCTHLTALTLCGLSGFDLSSCRAIASFIANKKCMMRELYLDHNHINDDGCRMIAESLRTNRRLRRLSFENKEITKEGYKSFIPVLCDTSSIESTLDSNHTLEQVNVSIARSSEIGDALRMNKTTDKRTVAELKVLSSHFSGYFDLTIVASLDTKLLPHLLAWFGRLKESKSTNLKDRQSCRSALYRVIRYSPELCGFPSFERMARLKAENQVATLALRNEQLEREANVAKSRIKALEREVEELRSNKRQKV